MKKRHQKVRSDNDEDFFEMADDKTPEPVEERPKGWPDEVPVLVEGDMTWWHGLPDHRRHNLIDWARFTFDMRGIAYPKVRAALDEVLRQRTRPPAQDLLLYLESRKHHKKEIPYDWLARIWNEAMHRCGYPIDEEKRRDTGVGMNEEHQ